jgi:hypothetical protein
MLEGDVSRNLLGGITDDAVDSPSAEAPFTARLEE